MMMKLCDDSALSSRATKTSDDLSVVKKTSGEVEYFGQQLGQAEIEHF